MTEDQKRMVQVAKDMLKKPWPNGFWTAERLALIRTVVEELVIIIEDRENFDGNR